MRGAAVMSNKRRTYPLRSPAYFVAPNGSDSNNGAAATPFATVSHATTAMRSGSKVTYIRSGRTYLAAGITSGATTLTVTAVGNMPTSGSYSVVIDDETLTVTSGANTTAWTVTRAALNSTAAAHLAGAAVDFVYPFAAILQLNNAGDANTTYSNYPGEKPVVDMNGATAFQGISIEQSGIWVNGIRFQNTRNTLIEPPGWTASYQNSSAVQVFSAAITVSNSKVTNCEAFNMNPASNETRNAPFVAMDGYNGVEFANNSIRNCGAGGIIADSGAAGLVGSNVWITDNICSGVCQEPTTGDLGAIHGWDGSDGSRIRMTLRNLVRDCGPSARFTGSGGNSTIGIYNDDKTRNNISFGNWISGVGGYAALIHGGQRNVFHNNVWDITNFFCCWLYQDDSYALSMTGNKAQTNIIYSSRNAQPIGYASAGSAMWMFEFDFTTPAYAAVSGNLYYDPSVTMTQNGLQNPGSSTVSNVDTAPTVGDPLFTNSAGGDYTLQAGSPAYSLSPPFLPIKPGTGPSLAGLPPVWAALANNVIRNPDPTVGSTLASASDATAFPTGGTWPTNWVWSGTALAAAPAVFYRGYDQAGNPVARFRIATASAGGTDVQFTFDNQAPGLSSTVYTVYATVSICGGNLANVNSITLYVQAYDAGLTTFTNVLIQPITLTGIPTRFAFTCSATPSSPATANVQAFLIISCTAATPIDLCVEIGDIQLVH